MNRNMKYREDLMLLYSGIFQEEWDFATNTTNLYFTDKGISTGKLYISLKVGSFGEYYHIKSVCNPVECEDSPDLLVSTTLYLNPNVPVENKLYLYYEGHEDQRHRLTQANCTPFFYYEIDIQSKVQARGDLLPYIYDRQGYIRRCTIQEIIR